MLKQVTNRLTRLRPQLLSVSARCQSSEPNPQPRSTEKSINQVSLLGRVGGEPQKRGNDKHSVVVFSLATNNRYENTDGEQTMKTEWHRISVFRPALQDTVYTYLRKGQRVYVTGRISYSEYKDNAGSTRQSTSIIADDVIFFQSNDS
uniref:Single-stranded DNA-binding protein n=1 Tax=Cuerna arida TaxID=1464854 RepID=A0A1B6EXH5_9HEMI